MTSLAAEGLGDKLGCCRPKGLIGEWFFLEYGVLDWRFFLVLGLASGAWGYMGRWGALGEYADWVSCL